MVNECMMLRALLLSRKELRSISRDTQALEFTSQRRSFTRLTKKLACHEHHGGSEVDKYLTMYDSIFRLIEITLISQWSVALHRRPHHTMQRILLILFPALSDTLDPEALTALVNARHRAKKRGVMPSTFEMRSLLDVLNTCAEHVADHITSYTPSDYALSG